MKYFITIAVMLCTLSVNAQEIKRNQWTVQPHVKTSAYFIQGAATFLRDKLMEGTNDMSTSEYADFITKNSWYIPEFELGAPFYSVSSADGAKLVKPVAWRQALWGDYSHTFDFSAGYEVAWKSLVSPFGAYISIDWEYQQFAIENSAEAGKYRTQMVVPSAGLRYRLWGGNFEKKWRPGIEIGAAYVHHFKYNNPHNYDLDAINNGIRGKIALGFEFPYLHSAIILQYEHDFFNLFNQDYIDDNGAKPFADFKSSFGQLNFKYLSLIHISEPTRPY